MPLLPIGRRGFASMDDTVEWDEEMLYDPLYNLTLFGVGQREGYAEHWSTHEMCLEEVE
jgi:hypothetical protein